MLSYGGLTKWQAHLRHSLQYPYLAYKYVIIKAFNWIIAVHKVK